MLGRRAEKRTLVERCTCSRGARVKRCALSNGARGLRGTRVQERTLHERHVLARHERHERRKAVESRKMKWRWLKQ